MLATADSVLVEGVTITDPNPSLVTVNRLNAQLVRLPSGNFEFEAYLPVEREPTADQPFRVLVKDAAVRFIDLAGADRFEQTILADDVLVEGRGESWIAQASPALPGLGSLNLTVQRSPELGLVMEGRTRALQLAPVLEHLLTTPEAELLPYLEGISAESLVVEGPVRLAVPPEGDAVLETQVDAQARGLVVRDFGSYSSANFEGVVTQSGARGTFELQKPGGEAQFVGSVDWSGQVDLGGTVVAAVDSFSVLPEPIQRLIPAEVSFTDAEATGFLAIEDGQAIRFKGAVAANRASYGDQVVTNLEAEVATSPDRLYAEEATAIWRGSPVAATVSYNLQSDALEGMVVLEEAQLERVAQLQGLTGTADVLALLQGTAANPVVDFQAVGHATYRAPEARQPLSGEFLGRGEYRDGLVALTSGRIETEQGVVALGGTTTPEGQLDLRVAATGVELEAFAPDLQGRGAFVGTLTGTLENPLLAGRAQVTSLQVGGQQIPLVVADISATREALRAQTVQAIRGSVTATGQLALRFSDGQISGQAEALGIPVAELREGLLGQLDIRNANVAGTLNDPIVTAQLAGTVAVPGGVKVTDARGTLRLEDRVALIPNFTADLAGGTITGSLRYAIAEDSARIEFDAENLELDQLTGRLAEASVSGTLSTEGAAVLHEGNLRYARAEGLFNGVTLNQTLIGSGPLSLNVDPSTISGAAQLGTLDRYIELEQFAMNRETERAEGLLTAYQVPIQDVYKALDRYIPEPQSQADAQIRTLDGLLDARMAFTGPLTDPNLDVEILEASELQLAGRDLGRVVTTLEKQEEDWVIERVTWDSEAGTLRASGVIDDDGEIRLDGDLSNFDLSLLALASADLQRLAGRASLSFAVEGSAQEPTILASLDARRTLVQTGDGGVEFGLVLDTIRVTESELVAGELQGGILAEGRLFYQGIEANVNAHLPLQYPLEIPQGQPVTASITVPPRDLSQVAQYFPGLQADGTTGQIFGRISANGVIGNIGLDGQVVLTADRLAIHGLDTNFTNAAAQVEISRNQLDVDARVTSEEGGTAVLRTNVALGQIGDRIRELASRGLPALLDLPATGQLELNEFRIDEEFGEEGAIVGTAQGTLSASGPLGSPLVQGTVAFEDGRFRMPDQDLVGGPEPDYLINPHFNVNVRLQDPLTFATSVAQLDLIGAGSLEGTLEAPVLAADLRVSDGELRLPTARVNIEPGGTLNVRYNVEPTGEVIARANVDLEGRTTVVDVQYGQLPERYEVTLNIRGNLLSEGEATITAVSDPPGLSQERILALLGEADLIAGLVGGADELETQQRIRNLLTGFAVPAVFDPITSRLAEGLGLDYLSVGFDPYSRFTLSFARPLGGNFVLQGRRQLSEPLPGLEPEYELKLTYRLPLRSRTFRRVAVSLGLDEQVPWKFEITYGFRF